MGWCVSPKSVAYWVPGETVGGMGDEPVGDRDDESVTVKMDARQLDDLARLFPDARNNSERVRRAVWMVTNATKIELERDPDRNELE